jgi:hypothetical protein
MIVCYIESVSKAELKKFPGIGDEQADKIIAGRPFGSKAWLVTRKIIPMTIYQAVKKRALCRLSAKDIPRSWRSPRTRNELIGGGLLDFA